MPFPFRPPPVPRRRGCRYTSLSGHIRACLRVTWYKRHSRYKPPYPSKRPSPSVPTHSTHTQKRSSLGAQLAFQVPFLQGRSAPHHSSHHLRRMFRSVIAAGPRLASPSTPVRQSLDPIRSRSRYHRTCPSSRSRSPPRPHPHNPRRHHHMPNRYVHSRAARSASAAARWVLSQHRTEAEMVES